MTPDEQAWRLSGACFLEHASLDIFLAPWPLSELNEVDAERTRRDNEIAKSYCRRCEVRQECLDFALRMNERAGIWGGTTPRDRRVIWRERRMVFA